MNLFLMALFGLVGAHVPKSFSILYLALFLSSVISLARVNHVDTMRQDSISLFRLIQVLVLIFSFAYPTSMLRYGF